MSSEERDRGDGGFETHEVWSYSQACCRIECAPPHDALRDEGTGETPFPTRETPGDEERAYPTIKRKEK